MCARAGPCACSWVCESCLGGSLWLFWVGRFRVENILWSDNPTDAQAELWILPDNATGATFTLDLLVCVCVCVCRGVLCRGVLCRGVRLGLKRRRWRMWAGRGV